LTAKIKITENVIRDQSQKSLVKSDLIQRSKITQSDLTSWSKIKRSKITTNTEHNSTTDWLRNHSSVLTFVQPWKWWSTDQHYNWSPFNDSTINTQQRLV